MTILNKEKILEVARALVDEGKYDKAIREYEKIILADPSDFRVKLRVAELHTKRKQMNEAINLYREVADAYEGEGFFLKAVTVSKSILRLNPSLIEVNERLAHLYEKMGLISDAVRQYGILASSLDAKDMKERVLEIRGKIVNLIPEDMTARVRLAELYQREGRMEESIEQYEQLAHQLEKTGKNKSKLADLLEKILSHRPDEHEKIIKLVDLYVELGDNKKALKWLEAGGELVETDVRLLNLSADLYSAQNQNETARGRYMKLVDLACAEGKIDMALNAYYNILLMYPDEEERLSPQVEELKPGATRELSLKAQKRRAQMEAEESQTDEDTADEGEPVASSKAQESRPEEKTRVNVEPPKQESKTETAIQSSPEDVTDKVELPKIDIAPPSDDDVKAADAALNLASAYEKMGLKEEAMLELKKARDVYVALVRAGIASDLVKKRLDEIRRMQGIKPAAQLSKKTPEVKTPTANKAASPPVAKAKKAETKISKKKKTEEKKPNRKKISFV